MKENLSLPVSLGHSCQTRFVIDYLGGDTRRMPFDFNISTREAIVSALQTDGQSLQQNAETARHYAMPTTGREGVEQSGFYFWHEYPLEGDDIRMKPGWLGEMQRVNEKYAALWERFATLARSDAPKTFILSNSQHNLKAFATDPDDFKTKFGLGRQAFLDISGALDAFGARNYKIVFLTQSISELEETADLRDERFDHLFVGILSLRPDNKLASLLTECLNEPRLEGVCGSYDNAEKQIVGVSDKVAIIYKAENGVPRAYGSLTKMNGGFIAFFEGRDQMFKVASAERSLYFSNGARWSRDMGATG